MKTLLLVLFIIMCSPPAFAKWEGAKIEIPPDENDPGVISAKKLGTYQTQYAIQPEVCENYRKHRQCVDAIPKGRRKDRTALTECEARHPWTGGADSNWNGQVSRQCDSRSEKPSSNKQVPQQPQKSGQPQHIDLLQEVLKLRK